MTDWTTPRTWSNNEIVTDTIMNVHVRDNLKHLKEHEDATTNVHGLGSNIALVGAKQGTRRIEFQTGTTSFSRGSQGEYEAQISITWANAFTSALGCFPMVAPSSYSGMRLRVISLSTTGATAGFGAWFDIGGPYTINAYFLGFGS